MVLERILGFCSSAWEIFVAHQPQRQFSKSWFYAGLENRIEIDSAGTGGWYIGEQADLRMRSAARELGFKITSRGRQVTNTDFQNFDLIIAMDSSNFNNLLPLQTEDDRAKLIQFRELMTTQHIEGVPDPYYGGPEGFKEVLNILQEGCKELLNRVSSSV